MIDPETFKVILTLIEACKAANEELCGVLDWALAESYDCRPKHKIEKTLDAAIRQGIDFMNQE